MPQEEWGEFFTKKMKMVPQTLINIIESSFAIATVRCVLSHLQLQAKINKTRKGFDWFLENSKENKREK